ncbi:uncharacterized protein LACBIDRAFT_329023 [Laccaria bicolor S238N-H82]|uniref:Predicted protein n=1 Tax=Laccaria bicolor (strain S238N-H82 / ATCC MYA-4686) TaxID=486041 RepID=B0DGT2_LACBS|nr:uncharacterized protein LACBIDRAFT_329023 [Laccaria bicolor S238N-H82]EDR06206.1 predicted protein [Laccaria bicolor S238N-H82]|eukprot:XP_001883067.1 predicted protein [Laccaria bicolor S238N-H82]
MFSRLGSNTTTIGHLRGLGRVSSLQLLVAPQFNRNAYHISSLSVSVTRSLACIARDFGTFLKSFKDDKSRTWFSLLFLRGCASDVKTQIIVEMLSSILLPSGLCLLSAIITPARAQFQWQFNKSYFHVIGNISGVPPYYMTAFAIGGTPTTTLIGTDASSLSWTVTQPVDAVGSEGGIPADIYEVTVLGGSSNTDCNGLSSSSDHSTSTILQSSTSLSHSKTESGTPQQTGLATVNATRKNKTPLIVGVTVPLVVIFVLGGSVLALLYLRKRRTRQAEKEDPLQPRQFRIEEESQRQAVNHTETPSPSGKHLAASRHAHSPATASNAMPSGSTTASSIPSGTSGVSSSNSTPSQTRPTQRTDATSEDVGPGEGETVFQHRDAAVVREIPPPFDGISDVTFGEVGRPSPKHNGYTHCASTDSDSCSLRHFGQNWG